MTSVFSTVLLFVCFNLNLVSAIGFNAATMPPSKTIRFTQLTHLRIDEITSLPFQIESIPYGDASIKLALPDLYQFYDRISIPGTMDPRAIELLAYIKDLLASPKNNRFNDLTKQHCNFMIYFIAEYFRSYYSSEGKGDITSSIKALVKHFLEKSYFYNDSALSVDLDMAVLKNRLVHASSL